MVDVPDTTTNIVSRSKNSSVRRHSNCPESSSLAESMDSVNVQIFVSLSARNSTDSSIFSLQIYIIIK